MENIKKGSTIQSLEIGMNILDLISSQRKPLKFSEIEDLTGMTKSNLYKYLHTLTHLNLLYRNPQTGSYVLGSKLIEYGMIAVDTEDVIDRITPYLQEINKKSSSTVLFSRWSHSGPMIVKEINTNRGYNIGAQMGTLLPILSAAGKVFVAFMSEKTILEWKEKELSRISVEKADFLEKECTVIRQKGISFAREPLVASISAVALPVFNYKKELLGVIILVDFSEKIPQSDQEDLSRYLINKSKEISEIFGYNPHAE